MARFVIEKHVKKQPLWLLSVLVTFPYDIKKSYPNVEIYQMLGVVLDYLDRFQYKRRNAMEFLGVSHNIHCTDSSITVSSFNDVPYLTIHLIDE